jgi:hypothetical protein
VEPSTDFARNLRVTIRRKICASSDSRSFHPLKTSASRGRKREQIQRGRILRTDKREKGDDPVLGHYAITHESLVPSILAILHGPSPVDRRRSLQGSQIPAKVVEPGVLQGR